MPALNKHQLGETGRLSWGILTFTHPMLNAHAPKQRENRVVNNFFKVEAPFSAWLYLEVAAGEEVAAGQRLGVFKDLFGAPQAELVAPYAGLVLMIVNHPIVEQGEWLISLAPLER
ncbi:hypothetical protein ABQX22_05205 [Xanthomonas sp. WHRI 1810A]|uniref:hypothetical protein n=1 Tax=Xanthomonas sp. WHRI 1810A TaxID=3161565 RepID=UPI0032E90AFF